MQVAMIAYRLMVGGPFEAAWQALAAAETPVMHTIDYFIKRQLLAWKADCGPSIDPSFPGVLTPGVSGSELAVVPYDSTGIFTVSNSYNPGPDMDIITVFGAYHSLNPWGSARAVSCTFSPAGSTVFTQKGVYIIPGDWSILAFPLALDGTTAPGWSLAGIFTTT
jgi:hypothetical protein